MGALLGVAALGARRTPAYVGGLVGLLPTAVMVAALLTDRF